MYCTLTCRIPASIVKQLLDFDIREAKPELRSIHDLHWKEGRKLPKKGAIETLNFIKAMHKAGKLPATTEELAHFSNVHVEQYGSSISYLLKKSYITKVDLVSSMKRGGRQVIRFQITDKGLAT